MNGRLGVVTVSVFATRRKSCGFKLGQGDVFLRAIKISSTPSFGWEVKPEVQCRKILRMMFRVVFWVILPCKMIVDRRFGGAYCLHYQG
jgi:hypothetical protein